MYAIYARQSVDRPDSISIESQIEYCKYETKGEEYKEYIDRGYSGKNTDRPMLQELLADIEKGSITKIIVYKLDRISRSILDFSNLMETLQLYQVEFISSTEKFDTSTPMGRAALNICIVFAQLERETIQKRVTDAYHSRSIKSLYMGGRIPYGFRLVNATIDGIRSSKYEIYEEEAEVLRIIYRLYAKPHTSYGDVIDYLIAHGITNRGKPWNRARISDYLRNPIYVKSDLSVYDFYKSGGTQIVNPSSDFAGTNGCYYYKEKKESERQPISKLARNSSLKLNSNCKNKSDRTKKLDNLVHTDFLKNENMTSNYLGGRLVLAPHEGIVSSVQWLKCQYKRKKNKQVQPVMKAKNTWLAGKVKCGICGYAIVLKQYPERRIKTEKEECGSNYPRYFLCSGHLNNKACPGPGTIYGDDLERVVHQEIGKKITEFTPFHKKYKLHESETVLALTREIDKIQGEIDSYIDKIITANEIVTDYINQRMETLHSRKQRLEQQLKQLTDHLESDAMVSRITPSLNHWDKFSFEEKQVIVDTLVEVIRVTQEGVEIWWRI
jgi:DNA invertase Pin-like site-specific DNA recombinase